MAMNDVIDNMEVGFRRERRLLVVFLLTVALALSTVVAVGAITVWRIRKDDINQIKRAEELILVNEKAVLCNQQYFDVIIDEALRKAGYVPNYPFRPYQGLKGEAVCPKPVLPPVVPTTSTTVAPTTTMPTTMPAGPPLTALPETS